MMAVLLTALLCSSLWAEDEKPALPELKEIVVAGPCCGIYALVAILDWGLMPFLPNDAFLRNAVCRIP